MARKTDYQKGITAGIALAKRKPAFRHHYHSYEHEIRSAVRDLEYKYGAVIGDLACPFTGEPSYMRMSWYRDGVCDGLKEGKGRKFAVAVFNGQGFYNVDSLAEQTVYDDPAYAWKRSWELDPCGHEYTSKDVLYINGACKHFGLEEYYGLR